MSTSTRIVDLPENITNQLIFLSNKSRTKNDLYEKIKEIL